MRQAVATPVPIKASFERPVLIRKALRSAPWCPDRPARLILIIQKKGTKAFVRAKFNKITCQNF